MLGNLLDGIVGDTGKISRMYLLVLIALIFLRSIDFIKHEHLTLRWKAVFRGEVWRVLTSVFYTGAISVSTAWEVYMTFTGLAKLEEEVFHGKRAAFLVLITHLWAVLVALHCFIVVFLEYPMQTTLVFDMFIALTYIWGQKCPNATNNIILFAVPARYMPWLHVVVQYFWGHNVTITQSFIGIFTGHTVYFVDFYLPTMPVTKDVQLLGGTPRVLSEALDGE